MKEVPTQELSRETPCCACGRAVGDVLFQEHEGAGFLCAECWLDRDHQIERDLLDLAYALLVNFRDDEDWRTCSREWQKNYLERLRRRRSKLS